MKSKNKSTRKPGGIGIAVAGPHDEGWELAHTRATWDEADALRTNIINETRRAARVRYVQPNYLVEWKA